eukprot:CAMPEP_0172414214 /NCGR_PEP_ID=MMETSP1064-20121228/901_1 /TAXON_ID=202472 /ORGANISM="Aulacoseira subarctica , Strain CCAP 1002/5" /LENGTH=323 /DNA_ID=CAMNT_0013150781 /DNA_START=54 /DNA_END=1022 /DNA_ORIENTATION=-
MEASLNKPKRVLTAYNFFFQDQRSKILSGEVDDCSVEGGDAAQEDFSQGDRHEKETNQSVALGKVSFSSLGKAVARRWRRLAPEDRVAFEEAAAADKERYKQEMALYSEEFKAIPNLVKKQKRTENRKKQNATKVSYYPKPDSFQGNHDDVLSHSITLRGLESDCRKARKTDNSPKISKSPTTAKHADFIQCGSEGCKEITSHLVTSSAHGETKPYFDASVRTEDSEHYSRQHIFQRPLLYGQTAPSTRPYPTQLPFHFEAPYAVRSDHQGSHVLVSSMPIPQVYHHPPPSYQVVLHPSFVNAPPEERYQEDLAQQQPRTVYW